MAGKLYYLKLHRTPIFIGAEESNQMSIDIGGSEWGGKNIEIGIKGLREEVE